MTTKGWTLTVNGPWTMLCTISNIQLIPTIILSTRASFMNSKLKENMCNTWTFSIRLVKKARAQMNSSAFPVIPNNVRNISWFWIRRQDFLTSLIKVKFLSVIKSDENDAWSLVGWLLEYDLISSSSCCIVSEQNLSKQRGIFPRIFSLIFLAFFSSGKLRFLFNCLGSIGSCQLSVGSPQYSNTTTQINSSSCFESCSKDSFIFSCLC